MVKSEIFQYPNVVGFGSGYKFTDGRPVGEAMVVFVRKKLALAALKPEEVIPREFKGAATDVMMIGDVKIQQPPTGKWRPLIGGISIGHFMITAGTLAIPCYDKDTNKPMLLSNNHVLANSNDCEFADPIWQPGPYDGGTPEDACAILVDWEPIKYMEEAPTCSLANGLVKLANAAAQLTKSKHRVRAYQEGDEVNYFDAAVAQPIDVQCDPMILEIGGPVTGISEPELGMRLRKYGRTTGYTEGNIIVKDATLQVSYGEGKAAMFTNQIVTTNMSAPGDSGSLCLGVNSMNAVALLFAGSDQATIESPILPIMERFNLYF